jgi:DNA mismatch endonuclease (patch repair protein)
MKGNRKKDTGPELALRRELHRRGLRYRVHSVPDPSLGCQADIVVRRARLAIFVDGCFWHGCPEHGVRPRSNADYWAKKIARNIARDGRNDAALRARGWRVVRVWEHERPGDAAAQIMALLD